MSRNKIFALILIIGSVVENVVNLTIYVNFSCLVLVFNNAGTGETQCSSSTKFLRIWLGLGLPSQGPKLSYHQPLPKCFREKKTSKSAKYRLQIRYSLNLFEEQKCMLVWTS